MNRGPGIAANGRGYVECGKRQRRAQGTRNISNGSAAGKPAPDFGQCRGYRVRMRGLRRLSGPYGGCRGHTLFYVVAEQVARLPPLLQGQRLEVSFLLKQT